MARGKRSTISQILSESSEDYLEAIYSLSKKQKVVRVKEISQKLNVRMPSVNAAMKLLARNELIHQELYGYIELTEKGSKLAQRIVCRHEKIFSFLSAILKIDTTKAEEEACRMEHVISKNTVDRLDALREYMIKNNISDSWLK